MSQISLYSQEENQTMKLEDSETIQIGRGFFQVKLLTLCMQLFTFNFLSVR